MRIHAAQNLNLGQCLFLIEIFSICRLLEKKGKYRQVQDDNGCAIFYKEIVFREFCKTQNGIIIVMPMPGLRRF